MKDNRIFEIEFTIKDAWFIPIVDCRLVFDADGASITITRQLSDSEPTTEHRYSPEEAEKLKKRFSGIHTELWDDEYEPVGDYVLDGTSWLLSVRYFDGSNLTRTGSNAWPDNWNLLLEFFGIHKDI